MFSIVIPIFNEENNITKLYEEILTALVDYQEYEIIFINDSSTDRSGQILKQLMNKKYLKFISNKTNRGQSFSIDRGIKNAKYDIIITLDGDGQNNPKDISKLLDVYFSKKFFSLVGGIRKNRKDNFIKKMSSIIANRVRSLILDDDCPDTGCSLKVFDKSVFLSFPFFDGLHRFLPALFKGYGKYTFFINVDHRPRISGISKYGTFDRLFKGIFDIIKVKKIIKKYKAKVF